MSFDLTDKMKPFFIVAGHYISRVLDFVEHSSNVGLHWYQQLLGWFVAHKTTLLQRLQQGFQLALQALAVLITMALFCYRAGHVLRLYSAQVATDYALEVAYLQDRHHPSSVPQLQAIWTIVQEELQHGWTLLMLWLERRASTLATAVTTDTPELASLTSAPTSLQKPVGFGSTTVTPKR